ncbi:Uracil-DNA glycosylase, family 1 [Bathymodiolus thermophilus thioautotrophic gill symbiont]|jgi:uracil-DNA glycosylase|uniref:Uracil-DNA glycosylase n=1 Tax=Bathymodiolus thermophilus thioautotrophic gill symbiont TaxID=2360 RepID=A0A1J5TVP1_9GAMM|nr:uracil-DNA glycosylase [Bathymodiolus thermophilus thioautotrophic gill symbiont]OIR24899.1 uracil-DNA glycosylase [Bathymodiolus thermophilus thioautotrophic gill symbiont]CAB5506077.1 Uracil-DNA glycosylase, family 1 (EC [Bathymodiolus thermophilus thioautotrophic gill symbiont]SGZ92408.1 Uracil-DNA glycosylase, family 1 [Bathymodiolus thermophilus thioautotrophic gill symbiont]
MIKKWHPQIATLLANESAQSLKTFLQQQKQAHKIIFPHSSNWFKAFELTPFDKVKVVILGQDPYHGDGQAHGLSFSVPNGVATPPSLKNIYKELALDLNIEPNASGNLERWATQGVLLLNSVLTVEKNTPSAHAKSGWVDFTDGVIDIISAQKQQVVFLLWGAYAQQKAALIDHDKHLVLSAAHPSPFSAHRGFFGCKHFSKTNEYLKMHNQKTINW